MPKSKSLKLTDMGDPSALLKLDASVTKLVLSHVIGFATALIERKTPTGDVYYGLKGSFEVIFPDGTMSSANVLYMPSALDPMVVDKLKVEDAPAALEFAMEIAVIRADNAAKYQYNVDDIVKAKEGDPLQAMREAVKAATAEPEAEAEKTPAPKGKGK